MSGDGLHVVDADGHLAEGRSFGTIAFERFPDQIRVRTDGVTGLAVEGRNYPEWHGPGAGCPPQHGLAPGISRETVEGMLADADLDMPLGIHGAPGIHLPKIGVDRFDNYIQVHCISFPFDQMTAMTALISGGVFDRHPALRVGFLEAGVGWVPYFVERMHGHYEKRGDWVRNGWRKDPRRYVEAGNVWVSCEPEETILPAVAGALGPDFIMYASDYPHWDSDWPDSTRPLRERSDLSDDVRAKIAGGNARRFYRLT